MARRLGNLHVRGIVRYAQVPVEPRLDVAVTECLLVDVHDLSQTCMGHFTREELRRRPSCRAGRRCIDAGVHLHARGNAERRDAVSHRVEYIARRSVSPREEDQVHVALRHCNCRASCVLRRSVPDIDRSYESGRKPCLPRLVLAHRAGVGEHLQPIETVELTQRLDGSRRGAGNGPHLQRPSIS